MAIALPTRAKLDTGTQSRASARPAVLLFAWSAFLFLYGIDAGDLYRNEGLRGRVAQEMYASGDWIVPRLYGRPIFSKPPLMYWLICLFSLPASEVTTVAARLPSVLAGFAVVALFFWYFRRCLGKQAGYLAALIVPLSVFWLDKAPSAEIDALQVAWVTGAILFFLRALEEEEQPASEPGGVARSSNTPLSPSDRGRGVGGEGVSLSRATVFWLLSALCLAAGTLTKWTAPAFLYGTAIPLLWYRGRLRLLLTPRHLLALALAVAIVLGWIMLAIGQTSTTEFTDAILREAAPRLMPSEHPKPYSWTETLLHPAVVFAVMLPWSLLLLVLWRSFSRDPKGSADSVPQATTLALPFGSRLNKVVFSNDRARRLYQALHCWLWPNLLFWSLHPDHTLRNRAPLFPAIAGLAVFAVLIWQEKQHALPAWLRSPRAWLTGFLVVWTAVKVVHVNVIVPDRSAERRVREKAITIAALLPTGAVLYLCNIKDECLLFYLGLDARRLDHLADIPPGQICILTEDEWREHRRTARLLLRTADGQGRPIYLAVL